jgi:hypothetical protein
MWRREFATGLGRVGEEVVPDRTRSPVFGPPMIQRQAASAFIVIMRDRKLNRYLGGLTSRLVAESLSAAVKARRG